MIEYIDTLLKFTWGHWQREGASIVSGYPSMDVSQMINNGGRGTGLNIDENPEAEYLDKLIVTLPKNQIKSLKARYIWCWPNYEAAKTFKVPVSTYSDRLNRAHDRLDAMIKRDNIFNWR